MYRRKNIARAFSVLMVVTALTIGGIVALNIRSQPPPPAPDSFHLPTREPVDPHFARPGNGAIDPGFYPATPALVPGR